MRRYVLALALLIPPGMMVTSASCATGTADSGPNDGGGCSLGQTQECPGTGICIGGQVCDNSGNWSSCLCQNDAGEIEVDGAVIPITGGGGPGDGGPGGSLGSGGVAGSGGVGGSGSKGGSGGGGGAGGVGGSGSLAGSGGTGGSAGKGGKGGAVKSRKQAIAIGLSEARKKGAKVPRKKSS